MYTKNKNELNFVKKFKQSMTLTIDGKKPLQCYDLSKVYFLTIEDLVWPLEGVNFGSVVKLKIKNSNIKKMITTLNRYHEGHGRIFAIDALYPRFKLYLVDWKSIVKLDLGDEYDGPISNINWKNIEKLNIGTSMRSFEEIKDIDWKKVKTLKCNIILDRKYDWGNVRKIVLPFSDRIIKHYYKVEKMIVKRKGLEFEDDEDPYCKDPDNRLDWNDECDCKDGCICDCECESESECGCECKCEEYLKDKNHRECLCFQRKVGDGFCICGKSCLKCTSCSWEKTFSKSITYKKK